MRGFLLASKPEGQKSLAPGIIEGQQISSILDEFPMLMEGQGANGDGDGTSLVHMLTRDDQILSQAAGRQSRKMRLRSA